MNRSPCSVLSKRQKLAEFLRCCSKKLLLNQGVQVHGAVIKEGFRFDLMLSNDLIDMYGKCGRVDAACAVFDRMVERNVVSWSSLMCGYIQNGNAKKSLFLFTQMGLSGVKPNEFTFSMNLKASSMLNRPYIGMQIHANCTKSGNDIVIVVANSIVDMYSKCGRIKEAACMFDFMPVRNLISWNSMISGYSIAGFGEKAVVLFREMLEDGQEPDEFTLTSALKACSDLAAVREGSQIHSFLIISGFPYLIKTSIAGALIDQYVKCGKLCEAQRVFSQIEEKNVISFSALFLGYAHGGNLADAMSLFRRFRESDVEADGFVLSSMIGVFADFALVEQGKQMHAYSIKVPSGSDLSVCNSIVDMYLKCGVIDEAERFFAEMSTRDVISWTVMITGYGKHGLGKEAVCLFNKMQSDDIEPDDVTYLAVLLACSHSGLVEEGQVYFSKLCSDHRIRARVEHYACMVDLLGRAGRLKEAKDIIYSMPLNPNIGIWQTLLSACRVHGDLDLGREVGEILLRLDGDNPVNYVMLSNIYADAGYWNECERIRELAKTKRLKKEAGRSWVEIDKEVHFFYGGDDTHPVIEKIHQVLKEMETRMKEELGYGYRMKYALRDVEEESKEESLRVHSEKLAIGLALVCGGWEGGGRVIRVFKNLRVCVDCHQFIKGLSKILEVAFVVRDANRFHRFENGECSCRDYW
ncbi:putative pentatricopeptide repeat-containing protein At3g15130 [Ricinus communis]|uniref:putative pentatricopeptide repeat-containing protein At3g15130 n=1 Tax=Ricinus communis TaxID=3988 RepID=UPI000772A9D2|nr:putative pentatricopeptide repeat-containing protein At3g15130 [Ricinus communis]|eukprot:XP_015573119.1 putative pentatricopeptide repeat-containing protein At3g15130 [Ricinus communis]